MDNLTHTLFAATLARTSLGRAGRGTTATLVIASNIPDIDILATAGGGIKYLEWHRGITHGPLGIIGLAALTAVVVSLSTPVLRRWRSRRAPSDIDSAPDATFAMIFAAALVGVAFHVLMDLPTSYGTRPLSPFSWRWYGLDWMPIIDIYLLIVLVSGLVFGRPSADARRRNAAMVFTFVAAIYGVRAYMHHQAMDLAPRLFGPTLPPRCDVPPETEPMLDSWPKPVPSPPAAGRRCLIEIAAIPTFVSPFDWRIVAQMSNSYEIHDVNLLDGRLREDEGDAVFWRQTLRYPNIWTDDVKRAATTRLGQVFLGFSRFPAARIARDAAGVTTVRFTDVRFVGGPFLSEQPRRRVQPFTATIRIGADGAIVSERLGM